MKQLFPIYLWLIGSSYAESPCEAQANVKLGRVNANKWESLHRRELFKLVELGTDNFNLTYKGQTWQREKKEGIYSKLQQSLGPATTKKSGAKKSTPSDAAPKMAKNIILFVGDGMNIDSVSGGRIHAGVVSDKHCGADFKQSFESEFDVSGWSKTYAVNHQTPDSACTSTALHTGVKGNMATIGSSGMASYAEKAKLFSWQANVNTTNCVAKGSIYQRLKYRRSKRKFKVGLVTNVYYAHATPASGYACVKNRILYGEITEQFKDAIIEDKIDVSFSGGDKYIGAVEDELRENNVQVLSRKTAEDKSMSTVDELKSLSWKDTRDGKKYNAFVGTYGEKTMPWPDQEEYKNVPTLKDMSEKALDLLHDSNKDGFFLLVEGGKIDKAHHENQAERSMEEVKQLDEAVLNIIEKLRAKKILDDTLIIVTADHGHTFTFTDTGKRGQEVTQKTNLDYGPFLKGYASDGKTTTKSGYYTGPGGPENHEACSAKHQGSRLNRLMGRFRGKDRSKMVKSAIKMMVAAHSGEDVPVYARGPFSELLSGHFEQSFISQVMMYASCVGESACDKTVDGHNKWGAPHCQKTCKDVVKNKRAAAVLRKSKKRKSKA